MTFTPGNDTQTITVAVNGDTIDEENETFFVNLSNAIGAVATESPGVGTITNDDGPPSVSVANSSGSEGGNLLFTVSLSQVSGKMVTVAYTTADALSGNPATVGVDYTPVSGTLTFAPNTSTQTISVPLLADLVVDDNEMFRIVLSNPTNATLSTATATGTIIDVPPARITGFVYVDSNNSGLKEGSEVGIEGATVQAIRNGAIVQTVYTAADGSYSLTGLQPGTYTVRELQPGFYLDGRDTHLGIDSSVNDQHTNIVLAPSATRQRLQLWRGHAAHRVRVRVLESAGVLLLGTGESAQWRGVSGTGHRPDARRRLDFGRRWMARAAFGEGPVRRQPGQRHDVSVQQRHATRGGVVGHAYRRAR